MTIVIRSVTGGSDPVGFAEIDTGLGLSEEVVIMPADALAQVADQPLALVMTRARVQATDRYRRDPEAVIIRQFTLNEAQTLTPTVTVRLDARSDDEALAELLGAPAARASGTLAGVLAARPWSAIDGDVATAWTSPFGDAVGQWIEVTPAPNVVSLQLTPVVDDKHATIASVRVARGGRETVVDLGDDVPGGLDNDGTTTIVVPAGSGPVRITVLATNGATTIDRRLGTPVGLPVAIVIAGGYGRNIDDTVAVHLGTVAIAREFA